MEKIHLKSPADRQFIPADLPMDAWDDLQPWFEKLEKRPVDTAEQLEAWFADRSELMAALSEEGGWRYIRMTVNTADKEAAAAYQSFVENIEPKVAPIQDRLNRKALGSPALEAVRAQPGYAVLLRGMEKAVEIFREENVALATKAQLLGQEYSTVMGAMTVEHEGQQIPLPRASALMQRPDRQLRQDLWHKVAQRRAADQDKLDDIFDQLVALRHQMALNAGFANFRDYMFASLGRFDYGPQDCFAFHEAVRQEVVPLLRERHALRKKRMQLDQLKPWDLAPDPLGREALQPFSDHQDLLTKSIATYEKVDPFMAQVLRTMDQEGRLDLDSRHGKAPGGYMYPLMESAVPFIFMNAAGTLRDMVTMMHEGGHAVHSILMSKQPLTDFQSTPSEVAELASMSMELLTLDHWNEFFDSADDLARAKEEHLEQVVETLPWVATIDAFQHWIYENPTHTRQERAEKWLTLLDDFGDGVTDWSGLEQYRATLWHRQLHLFEVPFYYIEYGLAQLGALAVWRNWQEKGAAALGDFKAALALGYTQPIGDIYARAGVRFDFSAAYIRSLMEPLKQELATS